MGLGGARDALSTDHSIDMPHSGPGVVLRIAVSVIGNSLGVREGNVVCLDEGFGTQLPIARHHFGNVNGLVALFECVGFKVLGKNLEVVEQRFTLVVEVDEYETAPDIDLRLGETELFKVHVSEVPCLGHVLQATV